MAGEGTVSANFYVDPGFKTFDLKYITLTVASIFGLHLGLHGAGKTTQNRQ